MIIRINYLKILKLQHDKCKFMKILVQYLWILHILRPTEPNTPFNDADHVGSFDF